MAFFFPGDALPIRNNDKTSIGIRISREGRDHSFVAVQAGELRDMRRGRFWINSPMKHYTPLMDDMVIGVITSKSQDAYKVDIGGPAWANLNFMHFPNCTKRNRPNLVAGDAVFVQVTEDDLFGEVQVSAISSSVPGLGHLKGGAIFDVGITKARYLLLSDHASQLEKTFSALIVVGINGRVLINAPSPKTVYNILRKIKQLA